MRVAVEERRQIQERVRSGHEECSCRGPDDRERGHEPRRFGAEGHPHGDERADDHEPTGVLGGGGQPRSCAGPGETGRAFPFVRDDREEQGERDEERRRHVRQDVVRLADVERHDRHEAGRERGVPGAPPHADAVDEQHRQRPEERGDRASPEIEIRRVDLVEGAPIAPRRTDQEAEDRHAQLYVEVESGVVEEMRIEVPGAQHLHDAGHDLGLVDADVERDAGAERHEAQKSGDCKDERQREDRRAHVTCFPPLAFDHRCSQKNGRRIECVRGRNPSVVVPLRPAPGSNLRQTLAHTLGIAPAPLNDLLSLLLQLEARALRVVDMPIGSSLLCVARKPTAQ